MFLKKLWLFSFFLFCLASEASEPIQDVDMFEADYLRCIKSGFADGCWTKTFLGHALPWEENELSVLRTNESAYVKWLDGQKIYKIYPGIKEVKAEIFQNRSYVLERDDGAAVALWISYWQVKSKWYIHEVLGSSDDEFVRSAVGMTRPQEKITN